MSAQTGTIIHGFSKLDAYTVESYGNGLAIEIRRNSTGQTVYMQGEEAAEMIESLEAAQNRSYSYAADEFLSDYFY